VKPSRWIAVALVLAVMFAGCSKPAPTDSKPAPPTQPAPKEKVSIRFQSWRLGDPTSGPLYKAWIEQFQKANQHITVEQEAVPNAQRLEKYTAQVLAGSPPDLVGLSAGDVVQFAGLGQVENLDAFYKKEGKAFEDQFAQVALALSKHNGSYFALTHELSTADAIWYNLDALKAAGLDPKDVTTSWDKFVAASKKLTAGDKYGMGMRGKDVTGAVSVLWTILTQKAGPLVQEAEIKQNLCSPGAKEAFKSYVELYTVHKVTPNPVDIDFTLQKQLFATGKTAFLHQGSWMKSIIEQDNPAMKGNFLPIPLPVIPGGKANSSVDAMSFMIGKGSKHPEEAWQLAKFMMTKERQMENLEKVGFLPAFKELLTDPKVQQDPIFGLYAKIILEGGLPRPRSVKANEIWTAVHVELQNALMGKKAPDAALEAACTKINTEILK